MSIDPHHPFKGRQYPGEVIMLSVRWYLRFPLSYEHVRELLVERGVQAGRQLHLALVQAICAEVAQTLPAAFEAEQ